MRDDRERFQPLGPPIRPAPEPKRPPPAVEVQPGVFRKPDGTFETRDYQPSNAPSKGRTMSEYRQIGTTTRQIKEAPTGAVYVWCNGRTCYPKALAETLGRDDITIEPSNWLRMSNVAGRHSLRVVVDHAMHADAEQREALRYLRDSAGSRA